MKRFLSLLLFLVLFSELIEFGQSTSIFIGTQVPLVYSAGFEMESGFGLAFNAQAGILTKPYDQAILEMLKKLGTDEALTNTIGHAFNYGFVLQPALKYHFKSWYTGIHYSYFSLVASDAPADLIQNYYGISIPILFRNNTFRLNSELMNAGALIGREFHLKNPIWQINLELSLGKTFWSSSKLTSDSGELPRLSAAVDEKLNEYYLDYGYLPSLNVFIVRKIK